jgi:multicomponent Na+:H+ antiporter subunit D
MMGSVAPFLIFFAAAALAAATRGRLRAAVMLAAPILGAVNLYLMPAETSVQISLLDLTLDLVRIDRLSLLFGYLFHLAAFLGAVFALHLRDRTEQVAAMIYAGSALGAVFAGDLITLFVFWEFLAVASTFVILARGTLRAYRAAMRYMVIQVLSGVILLVGALMLGKATGSFAFGFIGLQSLDAGLAGPASWLILLAFAIKCAFPFLHNWLTDAYPEATPTGTVFLSAFTTKVAVYSLARAFPGTELLIYAGATMTMFPIFFAVIENDLRRVLAYSMINQIGFMVVGIGIGTELAINGAVSHAFNDVIFKGLLLMSMGAVLYRTGRMNGSELGGLYKTMPVTTAFCIVGAASISAFPLFSGFVSKSMVMSAAMEEGYPVVWLALLFASAGVFHHAGIKIPYFAFFAHDSGLRPKEAPWNMLLAMGLAAAISIFNGAYPWLLYSMLPYPVEYVPYTGAHILVQVQLLFFSALAFVWLQLKGLYPPELPGINIDAEWSYRKLLPGFARWITTWAALLRNGLLRHGKHRAAGLFDLVSRYGGPEGRLARTRPSGYMALWMTILLSVFLLLSFL